MANRTYLLAVEEPSTTWSDDPEREILAEGINEIPVFWACGVTPQSAIRQAKPRICITHNPSHMLVTDHLSATQAII